MCGLTEATRNRGSCAGPTDEDEEDEDTVLDELDDNELNDDERELDDDDELKDEDLEEDADELKDEDLDDELDDLDDELEEELDDDEELEEAQKPISFQTPNRWFPVAGLYLF